MMVIKWLAGGAALAALALLTSAAGAAEKPQDDGPKVTVKLSISVKQYDPGKPSKGVVRCSVVNRSDETIEVALGLEERKNRLFAHGERQRWPLALRPRKLLKEKPTRASVKPKAEQAVFELSLDEILFQGMEGDPRRSRDRKWAWDWIARPEPPASPIHRWRQEGFVDQATFWAQVTVDGRDVSSEKVTLKIELGE